MPDEYLAKFSVRVPYVPPAQLLPNKPVHYLTRGKLKAEMRKQASGAVEQQTKDAIDRIAKREPRIRRSPYALLVEIAWPKGRRLPDLDNALASCKALLDGVADAVGIDDRHCVEASVRQRKAEPGEAAHVLATYTVLRNG